MPKTFGLLICDNNDFLRKRGKVISVQTDSHEQAMSFYLDGYGDELVGLTLASFCFDEYQQHYGYRYSIVNE